MSYLALVLVCLTLLVTTSQGAERVSARALLQQAFHRRQQSTEPVSTYRFKRDGNMMTMTELGDVMALDADSDLEVMQKSMSVQGTQVVKMQERYKGLLIPDAVVTLETDHEGNHVLDASGHMYRNIDLDLEGSSRLSAEEAKALCRQHNQDDDATFLAGISHEKVEEEIMFDDDGNPFPVFKTQYLISPPDVVERRPTCLINALNGSVMVSWNDIDTCVDCSAKGVGGNVKIGKINYGQLQRCLNVRHENGICYLENKYVRVLNNNYTRNMTDDKGNSNAEVGSYNCEEIDDYVNGAYSPLLDALFYGTVVAKMFEEWYNMSPLGEKITVRVHYGVNYVNAFWNGIECSFGDGDGYYMHPLVILDVMGHEIAHGVTEKNSHLYYYQQWGALNEAFSDMAGETAQEYLGEADWMMGFEMAVGEKPPLRYFDKPEKARGSIGHVNNYTEFLDPHYGSGVYNRAFYILVHDFNLPMKEIFGVFLHANRMYWHHMSDYEHAMCDVMKAAYDLGQDGSKFREAFAAVGVDVCIVEDHVLGLKNGKVYSNITVSRAVSPAFSFAVPGQFVKKVTVTATSPAGDVYIILSDKKWGVSQGGVQVYAEGLHSQSYELPEDSVGIYVSIALTTDSLTPMKDVTLVANLVQEEEESEEEPDEGEESSEEEGEGEGGEGEGGEGGEGDGEGGEGKESEEEGGEGEVELEGQVESQSIRVSGHMLQFFKSFVIIVFTPSDS
ncbi:hypothetical protein ACOMHN_001230 [Nucella lapillus]